MVHPKVFSYEGTSPGISHAHFWGNVQIFQTSSWIRIAIPAWIGQLLSDLGNLVGSVPTANLCWCNSMARCETCTISKKVYKKKPIAIIGRRWDTWALKLGKKATLLPFFCRHAALLGFGSIFQKIPNGKGVNPFAAFCCQQHHAGLKQCTHVMNKGYCSWPSVQLLIDIVRIV